MHILRYLQHRSLGRYILRLLSYHIASGPFTAILIAVITHLSFITAFNFPAVHRMLELLSGLRWHQEMERPAGEGPLLFLPFQRIHMWSDANKPVQSTRYILSHNIRRNRVLCDARHGNASPRGSGEGLKRRHNKKSPPSTSYNTKKDVLLAFALVKRERYSIWLDSCKNRKIARTTERKFMRGEDNT